MEHLGFYSLFPSLLLTRLTPFEEGLKQWLSDPTVTGNKKEATRRIRQTLENNSESLDLHYLQLSEIPKEIGQLKNLKILELHENDLSSLPKEIGQLEKLEELYVYRNKLTSLPSEIKQLFDLSRLNLSCNQLTSPLAEIGRLSNLTSLDLWGNHYLNEIPLSLGNLPGLTHINVYGTEVPKETVEVILRQCRSKRDAQAAEALPEKLTTWQLIGKNTQDLSQIEDFTESEKMILHEWLVRLERTRDFSTRQSSLACAVCDILASVFNNDEFKALFFNQAEANNSDCEDRAAMSLNEIYLAWKILCKPEGTPLKEKLTLMTGCAKTLSLRKEIGKLYFNHKENVEVYLYCERELRDKLQLVTAIQDMNHPDYAKKQEIDLESLEKAVKENFFDELNEIPIFEKTLMQDPEMKKNMEKIEKRFRKALEEAEKSQKDGDVNAQSIQHMTELEEAKKQAAFTWYNQKI